MEVGGSGRRYARRFAVAFVLACLVHLPLTPVMPLLRLARTAEKLRDDDRSWDYDAPPVSSEPMEIVDLVPPPPKPAEKDAFTVPKAALEGKPVDAKPAEPKGEVRFAEGAAPEPPKPAEPAPDETSEDAALPKKKTAEDDPKATPDAPKAGDKKPVGLAGELAKQVVGKPNVTLALWMAPLRDHALGKRFDNLFACSPEWRTFLDAGVSPMSDLDGMLVTGPQITDITKSTVAVQHHLASSRVTDLFSTLVAKSGAVGKFVRDDVAQILVRRHVRILFPHATHMVFMAPTSGWEPIHDQRAPLALPDPNGRAISLTLQKPAKPLGKVVSLPARLAELRVDVFLDADGGADLQLDFDDVSEEAAAADAARVEAALGTMFGDLSLVAQAASALLAGGRKLELPRPRFEAVEKRITATIHVPPENAEGVLGLAGRFVCPHRKPAPSTPK